MSSRIRWFSLGLGVGSYLVLKGERVVRSKVEALQPTNVLKRGGEALVGLGDDLVESVLGGIDAWKGELSKARSNTVYEGKAEQIETGAGTRKTSLVSAYPQREVRR